jgi:regulator of sirC expression with transglutaminase-like and TPR domain
MLLECRSYRRRPMEALEQFATAVSVHANEVRLDLATLWIAKCAHSELDVDAACVQLDELANECPTRTFDGLRSFLFQTGAFSGNTSDYGDPENSYLDSVLARRMGIPITLSVLMIEVGRRLGVAVRGVGMPGHFLVEDSTRADRWCDPFHGGVLHDLEGCRALFARVHGDATAFTPTLLAPVSSHAILSRILTNLEHGRAGADPAQLAWMCELHLSLPNLNAADRRHVEVLRRSVRARWN